MRRYLYLLAVLLAIGTGVAVLVLRPRGAATPDATKIISVAEQMAASTDLMDPAKTAEEFGLPLELGVRTRRPTRCGGHPIQVSQGWQLPPHQSPWFVTESQAKPQPMFMLQLEAQPEACPGDPANLPIVARFGEVQAWRCIHMSDLGPIADRFKMIHERNDAHIEAREIARPESRKARLELIFYDHWAGKDGCLFSVAVTVRNS